MSWQLKQHDFDHTVQRHYAVLHDPATGAEHHLVIFTGHNSCPTCGHVKPIDAVGALDFKAILKEELANLEKSRAQSREYANKFNIPAAKVTK
jgi:hypothetical protein